MDDQPRITSQEKTKNPKRVEQGKRLAAISKAAKEKKMRERILAEQEMDKEMLKESRSNSAFLLVAGAPLFVSTGGYYVYKNKETPKVEEVVVESPPKTRQNNLVNYFN